MSVFILDDTLETVGIIDDFYSLIWTERHYKAGDFELELPISYAESDLLIFGNYLLNPDSDVIMLISGKKTVQGEDSDSIVISGESSESLLKRRSILFPQKLWGEAESTIYNLVDMNVTFPGVLTRDIDIIETWNGDRVLPQVYYEDEHPIASVYDICVDICKLTGLGFKMMREWVEGAWRFTFYVYAGTDRSAQQTDVPQVIFSREFDNLLTGSIYMRHDDSVNLVDVLIDDPFVPSGHYRVWYLIPFLGDPPPEPEGMDLYEKAMEVTINRDADPENPLSDIEFLWAMSTRAMEVINDKKPISVVEGTFDINGVFQYGVDFFMGDVIEVSVYGSQTPARVIELVRSYSPEGIDSYMSVDTTDVTA